MSSSPSTTAPVKLLPRNVAALRPGQDAQGATRIAAGNPVSTRLESAVGNCFPGLEFDARNLERRFFPFLEIELGADNRGPEMAVVSVDLDAVASSGLPAAVQQTYKSLAKDLKAGRTCRVERITGDFGPLGMLSFALDDITVRSMGAGRLPADAWTAARLLKEGSEVTLQMARHPNSTALSLTGKRVRYLEDDGALSRMFSPGELTQSLCSPWTHDFRDCACYYWASNHPDLALPPMPAGASPVDPKWNLATNWERADRSLENPPVNTQDDDVPIMAHHAINRDWQQLNFVLERREQISPYQPSAFNATALPDLATLKVYLQYAAGVELAVMQEYLCAAWSLQKPNGQSATLRDDLRAAFAEILRVAIGEMRHLRAVNDVLARFPSEGPFMPALRVASSIPLGPVGEFRPIEFRAATALAIDDFIAIEAPSLSVDGVYARILKTLESGLGDDEQQQAIRTVMAEGEDHWQTFLFVKEWLGRHSEPDYLIPALKPPPKANPLHQVLQNRYRDLLATLRDAYTKRIPAGAAQINQARNFMLDPQGIEGALNDIAAQQMLVVFDPIGDPQFAPIGPPPP